MTELFKVWLEIERVDEENDIYESTQNCECLKQFDNMDDASDFFDSIISSVTDRPVNKISLDGKHVVKFEFDTKHLEMPVDEIIHNYFLPAVSQLKFLYDKKKETKIENGEKK